MAKNQEQKKLKRQKIATPAELEIKVADGDSVKEEQQESRRLKAADAALAEAMALRSDALADKEETGPIPGSSAVRALTAVLLAEFKQHAVATKEWNQMANAAWGARMSEHSNSLAMEMERRSTQLFVTCKAALDTVPSAVAAAMETVPTAISEQVDGFKEQVSGVAPAVVDAVVPAVVQGLIKSVEFNEHLQGAVETVVRSTKFLEKSIEAVQAVLDSPQFQDKVSGAVKAVMLSAEFMDAIAARVTLAQQPVMQQLLQQTSPVSHAPYPSFSSPPPPGTQHQHSQWQQPQGRPGGSSW